jgi:hypothetical protein
VEKVGIIDELIVSRWIVLHKTFTGFCQSSSIIACAEKNNAIHKIAWTEPNLTIPRILFPGSKFTERCGTEALTLLQPQTSIHTGCLQASRRT